MEANKLTIPAELTVSTMKTAVDIGHFALRYGGELIQRVRPGYISPEVQEQQATLKDFEHHFGVAGDLLELVDDDELERRVSLTAEAVLETGLIDDTTSLIELRPVVPYDSLKDRTFNARTEKIVGMLRDTLSQNFGVDAIYFSHPIIPAEHEYSPNNPLHTWGEVAKELDGYKHQMVSHTSHEHLAMLAITEPTHLDHFFGPQVASGPEGPLPNRFLVLEKVGRLPEDNVLGRRSINRTSEFVSA